MSVSMIISVISVLIVFSMIVSGVSYSRQQAMEKRQRQISKYRQQADEILGHIQLLLKVDPEYNLIIQLQNLAVNTLQSAYNLAPQDQITNDNLKNQKHRLQEFKDGQRDHEVHDYIETSTELSQSQLQLGQIDKLLDIYRNRGALSFQKSNEFKDHLKKIKLNLTVNSHIHQAKCCGENNDILMYQMHIKQAREVLKKSHLEENVKNKRIKKLTEILNEVKKTNKIVSEDIKKTIKEQTITSDHKANF